MKRFSLSNYSWLENRAQLFDFIEIVNVLFLCMSNFLFMQLKPFMFFFWGLSYVWTPFIGLFAERSSTWWMCKRLFWRALPDYWGKEGSRTQAEAERGEWRGGVPKKIEKCFTEPGREIVEYFRKMKIIHQNIDNAVSLQKVLPTTSIFRICGLRGFRLSCM